MNVWELYSPDLVMDLYELTMAASYLDEGMAGEATFSLFIRDYPVDRTFFVSAGLDHLLDILSDFRFTPESIDYVASLGKFSPSFLDYLRKFRFSGSIRAIPEGRIFFCHEPVLEVTGPIIETQLIETLVMNVIQLETMLASKTARVFHAASGKGLIDFGMRRAHGLDASVKAARAGYLTGFLGTSNLLAGKIYGIPVFGTMAHSYVTSFKCEMDSFLAFARAFPTNTVLLIDTYDTISGAKKALEVAKMMAGEGKRLLGVRLDSGDMAALSRKVRSIFDDAGFPEVQILASGSLDEGGIEDLTARGAAVDMYAVGTRVDVSADAPYLDIAYKLVEYEGRPVLKLSSGKKTWVGKKQVYRFYDDRGQMDHDRLGLLAAGDSEGEPLLELVMDGGRRLHAPEPLERIRARFEMESKRLPEKYRVVHPADMYPVMISQSLRELDDKAAESKRCEEIEVCG